MPVLRVDVVFETIPSPLPNRIPNTQIDKNNPSLSQSEKGTKKKYIRVTK